MTAVRQLASHTGERTLEIFKSTPRLNAWIFSKLAPGVSGDVLECGSGVGNISRLLRARATHLVLTDTEPRYLDELGRSFAGDAGVTVSAYDLDHAPPPAVAARRYDAIVAVNVIEHIADDRLAVEVTRAPAANHERRLRCRCATYPLLQRADCGVSRRTAGSRIERARSGDNRHRADSGNRAERSVIAPPRSCLCK